MAEVTVEFKIKEGQLASSLANELRELADKLAPQCDPVPECDESNKSEEAAPYYGYFVGRTYGTCGALTVNGVDIMAKIAQLESDIRRLESFPRSCGGCCNKGVSYPSVWY